MLHLPRALPAGLALSLMALLCGVAMAASPARESKKPADPVRSTILKVARNGGIDATERAGYLRSWSSALSTERRLSGQRRVELGYVIGVVRRLAKAKKLGARLKVVFLILDRNREWWAKAGPPGSGARLRFDGSRVIFQYFPGKGLQFHPLANFGQANGYWTGKRNSDLRSLLDDLVVPVGRAGRVRHLGVLLRLRRVAAVDLGMAQGTAVQALARGGAAAPRPRLTSRWRSARGAPSSAPTPTGVHSVQGQDDWYSALQLRAAAERAERDAPGGQRDPDLRGDRRRRDGRRLSRPATARRAATSRATTPARGRCTDRPGGKPGPRGEPQLPHAQPRLRRNLCKATKAESYCTEADHFTAYLKEDPKLDPAAAFPSPAGPAGAFGSASSCRRSRGSRSSCAGVGAHLPRHRRDLPTASATSAGCRRPRSVSARTPSSCPRATWQATRTPRQATCA